MRFVFILTLTAMLYASASTVADPQPLIPASTKMLHDEHDVSYGHVDNPWLNDHEFLHIRENGAISVYDLVQHTDRKLDRLTGKIHGRFQPIYGMKVSPDGRSVCVQNDVSGSNVAVYSLESAKEYLFPTNDRAVFPFWNTDNTLLQLYFDSSTGQTQLTYALLHAFGKPPKIQLPPTLPQGFDRLDVIGETSLTNIVARDPDDDNTQTSAAIATNAVASTTAAPTMQSTQHVSVWSLYQDKPLNEWTFPLAGTVSDLALSPDGARIAWILDNRPSPTARGTVSLWITGVDGSDQHEVGFVDPSTEQSNSGNATDKPVAPSIPHNIHWSPNGKIISFAFSGDIYTVPAE